VDVLQFLQFLLKFLMLLASVTGGKRLPLRKGDVLELVRESGGIAASDCWRKNRFNGFRRTVVKQWESAI